LLFSVLSPLRSPCGPALRTAIEQVVYSGALHDAAIAYTDYEKLDSLTLAAVRHILQIPPRTLTAFLRWELRLPPSRLRAHKRALRWAQQLWHGSWTGQEIMQPYLEDNTSRQQADEIHPIFEMGPVGRLTRILKEYDLTWTALSIQKIKDDKTKTGSPRPHAQRLSPHGIGSTWTTPRVSCNPQKGAGYQHGNGRGGL
jgi:hypothetical protein